MKNSKGERSDNKKGGHKKAPPAPAPVHLLDDLEDDIVVVEDAAPSAQKKKRTLDDFLEEEEDEPAPAPKKKHRGEGHKDGTVREEKKRKSEKSDGVKEKKDGNTPVASVPAVPVEVVVPSKKARKERKREKEERRRAEEGAAVPIETERSTKQHKDKGKDRDKDRDKDKDKDKTAKTKEKAAEPKGKPPPVPPPAVPERAAEKKAKKEKKEKKKRKEREEEARKEKGPAQPQHQAAAEEEPRRWGLDTADENYGNPLAAFPDRGPGHPSTTNGKTGARGKVRTDSDSDDEGGEGGLWTKLRSFEWGPEVRDLVLHLVQDETGVQFAHSVLQHWPTEKLRVLCTGMHPIHLARLAGGWPAEKAAAVLSALKEDSALLRATRELEPEDLVSFLPLLKPKRIRAVLLGLYFASKDPHLSGKEARAVIEALGPEGGRLRRKALKGVDGELVAAVLRGEDPMDVGGSDSYDSSFIVSDESDGDGEEGSEDDGLMEDEAESGEEEEDEEDEGEEED